MNGLKLKPQMVVIDLDNTLYEYAPCHQLGQEALIHFLHANLDVNPQVLEAGILKARETVKLRLGPTGSSHSRLLYLEQLLDDLDLGYRPELLIDAEQVYWGAYLSIMKLRESSESFLLACRRASIALVVLTDLTSQIQHRKIVRLGIGQLLDGVISSEFIGVDKIGFAGFEYVLLHRNRQPLSDVWFVGDSDVDYPDPARLNQFLPSARTRFFNMNRHSFAELRDLIE